MLLRVRGAGDVARAQSKLRREGRSTITERVEWSDTRTQERKDFSAMSVRQAVSNMDTIHVEEQLVHAFCEQPHLPSRQPLRRCAVPEPQGGGGRLTGRRRGVRPAVADPVAQEIQQRRR